MVQAGPMKDHIVPDDMDSQQLQQNEDKNKLHLFIGKVPMALPLFRRNTSLTVSGFHTPWTSLQKLFQLWPMVDLRKKVKETCYVCQSCFQPQWSKTDRLG